MTTESIAVTTSVTATNGQNSRHGRMPAPFMTMISESLLSFCSMCATAITSAIGVST